MKKELFWFIIIETGIIREINEKFREVLNIHSIVCILETDVNSLPQYGSSK